MNVLELQASIHSLIPKITDKEKLKELVTLLWNMVDEPETLESMPPELKEALEESYDESQWTTLEDAKPLFAAWLNK